MRMLLRQKTNVYAYDTFELCKNNDLFFFGLYFVEIQLKLILSLPR